MINSLEKVPEIPSSVVASSEVIEKVNQVMHSGFEIPLEDLRPEAHVFNDLGLDSLDAIDMVVHLEDQLGIKVDGERFMTVRTMQDIYQLVQELAQQAKNKTAQPEG